MLHRALDAFRLGVDEHEVQAQRVLAQGHRRDQEQVELDEHGELEQTVEVRGLAVHPEATRRLDELLRGGRGLETAPGHRFDRGPQGAVESIDVLLPG